LHERGVQEGVVAYLAAIDELLSSDTVVSGEQMKTNNNISNKAEIVSTLLTQFNKTRTD
jgi:hypothetical protein